MKLTLLICINIVLVLGFTNIFYPLNKFRIWNTVLYVIKSPYYLISNLYIYLKNLFTKDTEILHRPIDIVDSVPNRDINSEFRPYRPRPTIEPDYDMYPVPKLKTIIKKKEIKKWKYIKLTKHNDKFKMPDFKVWIANKINNDFNQIFTK